MTFYCNGKKAFCTESECKDTDCEYYNGEGGVYQHELVKLKTNEDRLCSMLGLALAQHLVDDIGWDCNLCSEHKRLDNEPLLRGEKCDEKCVEHCLEWLKQPAKED